VDCDNQLRLVKCDHDAHSNPSDVSGETWLPKSVSVDADGLFDHSFDIRDIRFEPPQFVLRMPRQMHALLSI
jgi:hypothetical protein